MDKKLKSKLLNKLCPGGVWKLSNVMKSVLRYQISCLYKREVSEDETRYPQSSAGMRAFLIKFFSRHYLQSQNSLIDYISSNDFFDIINKNQIKIIDIGSGPAVTSLAITDMITYLIEYLQGIGQWSKSKKIKVDYVLNDTSSICLGVGQNMLRDYFLRRYNKALIHSHTISIHKPFPDNMSHINRIRLNSGTYDIVTFSYVLSPLIEDKDFRRLVSGLLDVESVCNNKGRILILQDKFQKTLIRRMSKAISVPCHKEESNQQIYPKRNDNETYTYSYYSCLYAPKKNVNVPLHNVA